MRRFFLPSLVSFLVSLSAVADSGMWGQRGFPQRFVISGNFLYAADGRGVSVYNVASPAAITRIDVEWSDDETYDLAFMGTSELVVATRGGIERFAIRSNGTLDRLSGAVSDKRISRVAANAAYVAAVSDRTVMLFERQGETLTSVRNYTLPGAVSAIAFAGSSLFVAADAVPLHVFAPPAAERIALLPGVAAEAMAVSGDVLWTTSPSAGLSGIDISDPASPRVIGSAGRELQLRGLAAAGSRVYAFEFPNRIHVYDVSKPAEPRLTASIVEWVQAIAASGTRFFVSGPVVDEEELKFNAKLIAHQTGKPVRAFDAANLAAPVLAGELQDLAGPVSGVWTDGSVAYVVDPPYLRVLDVSRTADPREVTRLEIPNIQDHIKVKNGLAILYGRAFVNLVDVSVPLRPRFLGSWDAQGHTPGGAAILQSRFIEANDHSGMHVVDISNPANPVQIGGRKWHYLDIAAGDDVAYALMQDTMLVVEIVGERTIVDRASVTIRDVQVDTVPPNAARPEFLMTRGEDGLRLFSLGDRFSPEQIDFLPLVGLEVFATGDRTAYVARDGRLLFTPILDRLAVEETSLRVTSAMQMSVAGEKIVVADRYSVRVYGPDTAPPPPPPAPPAASGRRRGVRP